MAAVAVVLAEGPHMASLIATGRPRGVYLVRLESTAGTFTRRIIVRPRVSDVAGGAWSRADGWRRRPFGPRVDG